MAVFRDKKNGSWYVQFRFTDWKGQRQQKLKRGFSTKKEAQNWEREFLMKKQADVDMTFESFVELYEKNMKPKLKLNTWLSKEHIIRTKILPYFKKRKLAEITARDVIDWQNEIRQLKKSNGEPYSADYLENIHTQLSCLFNHAIKYYGLQINPAAQAGSMGDENPKEMLFWMKEEYMKFIDVHFKSPTGDYMEMFDQMVESGTISTRGLKADAEKFGELVFDVNSAYFYNHGGYDFAKQFYADAYKAAVSIVGGEQYILSAVMHADERNRAMSEKLGEDVYHYHLHVVYIPVVEKEVRWTKRCKDPALVGNVKERIHQVSMSKKWASQPAIGEDGQPLLTKSGKPVLKKSYSVLQDDFYNAMRSAGYTDLERGERGSSEEHLTVTQFKVEREQGRLEGLTEQTAQKAQEAAVLGKKIERYQKQEVAIQKVDAIEVKPVPLSSTKVILERKEYEALKATAKKYIAQEKREGVLQKTLDAAKRLINELKAEIASLREELSYYRSPKFQMKLHKIEKENFDLRDKLRVYNLIIDRHDLGRFFGKNRDMGRSRDEAR